MVNEPWLAAQGDKRTAVKTCSFSSVHVVQIEATFAFLCPRRLGQSKKAECFPTSRLRPQNRCRTASGG